MAKDEYVNQKAIQRAYRILEKRTRIVCNADNHNFCNAVDNLLYVILNIAEIKTMLQEYFSAPVELDTVIPMLKEKSDIHVYLPYDDDSRIKFVLQFFQAISQQTLSLNFDEYLYHSYCIDCKFEEGFRNFVNQIIAPCLEDLLDKVKYHIEDNFSNNKRKYKLRRLTIHIENNSGNISIGNNNRQRYMKKKEGSFMNNYSNNIHGSVQKMQIQQGGERNIQKMEENPIEYQEVIETIEKINKRIDNINEEFGEQSQSFKQNLDEALNLARERENPSRIRYLLSAARDLAISVTGSIIAPGIVQALSNLL